MKHSRSYWSKPAWIYLMIIVSMFKISLRRLVSQTSSTRICKAKLQSFLFHFLIFHFWCPSPFNWCTAHTPYLPEAFCVWSSMSPCLIAFVAMWPWGGFSWSSGQICAGKEFFICTRFHARGFHVHCQSCVNRIPRLSAMLSDKRRQEGDLYS
jgi:hypothetical protein